MTIAKKNLLFRILVALFFVPAILYSFYSGGVFLYLALTAIIFGLSSEFGTLPTFDFNGYQETLLVAGSLAIPLIIWLGSPVPLEALFIALCTVWFLLELTRRPLSGGMRRSMAGPFVFFLFALVPSLAFQLNSANGLFAILPFVIVWTADTSAYFAGNALKGPKMTPTLSPNKTWAGFFGEILGAAIVGVVFRLLWPGVFDWGIMFFAIPAGLIAVLGDLFESKVKRELSIKDSSDAIPGHGGFWDRFDSWLFVQIWAWIYFVIF